MTVEAKTTKPNNKAWKKLLPLDAETVARLNRAAHLLGIPATAFIRLALHRAFEQLLDIITQVVDASAQDYVEAKARGFYKVKSKKGFPRGCSESLERFFDFTREGWFSRHPNPIPSGGR